MADLSIEGSPLGTLDLLFGNGIWGPFWVSDQIGAIIYVDTNGDVVARKTTDGGANWSSATVLEAETAVSLAAWFDQQTPGDTGDLIHIAYHADTGGNIRYANFDISAGTWSTPNTVGSLNANATANNNQIAIHKTRSGNIIVTAVTSAVGNVAAKASSPWSSWTAITSPFESNANDQVLGCVPNTGDNNDGAILFWDISANQISIKVYDDSGNSWTETIIASSMAESTTWKQMMSTMRLSDGHILLAAWSQFDNAAADLLVFDIYADTVSSVFFAQKTNVLTNTDNAAMVDIFVDQNTDDVYVAYGIGTNPTADLIINYKKSTDDMNTWGDQTLMQEDASDDHRVLNSGAMGNQSSGRYQPAWFDDDDLEIYISLANDILLNKPTVALNSPANAGIVVTTTPTLDFTGSDPANTSLNYEVQIDTVNTFDSQGGETIEEVITSDTFWTCPEGVTSVAIHAWGGGGGGHGEDGTQGGGGGGGGAYSKKNSFSVTAGQKYKVKIGAGGAGGASGVDGTAGGDSWFNSTSDVLAKGGLGGVGGNSTVAGGQASSGVGDTKTNGGNGGAGGGANGGAGGGSGGTGGNGGNGANGNGGGASGGSAGSGTGGYPGFQGGAGSSANGTAPAVTAGNYGAGGGGGGDGSGAVGATGHSGKVVLVYTANKYPLIDKVSGGNATTETFTATDTWTAPVGVNSVNVEVWGAGGGGGGSNGGNPLGGAGGGGGAYSASNGVSVTPRTTYDVVVGTGGAGGAATPTNGGTGGDSYFNTAGTVMAKGGTGGTANSTTVGQGGASGSGVGTTKNSGGNGGQSALAGGGGGGGSAGSGGVGGTGGNAGVGSGGTAGTAGSGGGAAGGAGGSSAAGNAGSLPGGGGGGSGGNAVGGAGRDGQVKITYTPGDAGFDDPDSADTDPFTTGNNITYTLQSALSEGQTYYWRVRARDPNGSNAWGPWSSTRSFTVQTGVTKTFTIDAIVKEINTKTFTIDGIVFATNTKTFTIDGVVVVSGTLRIDLWSMSFEEPFVLKTFTIDAIVKEINTKTFTIDAIVFATNTTTFTIDGIIFATNTKTFTIDAVVLAQTTNTFTIDGIVKETFTKTFTADAIIFATNTQTFTIDGIIFATNTNTFTIDGKIATRINLVTHPSFELGDVGDGNIPTGWTSFHSGGTPVYKGIDDDIPHDRTKLFKIEATTNVDTGIRLNITGLEAGAEYTISVWAKSNAEVDNASFVVSNEQNGSGGSQTQNANWNGAFEGRKSITITPTTTSLEIFLGMGAFGAQSNGIVWFDAVLFERGGQALPYFDGQRTNAEWQGTTDASKSSLFTWITEATFTIDAIIKEVNIKTFTIDGIVFATSISTFTIDAIVKAQDTEIFSIDGIVQVQGNTNTFTADGIVLAQTTKTFTIDGIIFATNTLTFTIDGIVVVTFDETFTIDGIIKATTPSLFTIDGIVKAQDTEVFTIDGIVLQTQTLTFTIDGIVKETITKTFTIDGIVQALTTKTFTIDGIIYATNTSTFTIDGKIALRINSVPYPSFEQDTPGDDVIPTGWSSFGNDPDTYKGVIAENPASGSNSFKISSTIQRDTGIRLNITTLTIGQEITISVWVKSTVDVDNGTFVVSNEQNGSGGAQTSNANWNGAFEGRRSITITPTTTSLEIFLGMGAFGSTSDGTVWFDAVLLEVGDTALDYFDGDYPNAEWQGTTRASKSSLYAGITSVTFTIDAIVKEINTKTFTIDGIVKAVTLATFTIDGIIFATNTSTFTIDGLVRATQTQIITIDGIIKVLNNEKTFTIDGIVLALTTKTFTIDAIIFATNTATFTADGIVKVLDNPKTFTIDGIVRAETTKTFTIDAIIFASNTLSFTIDGIIFATNTSTFTIDGIIFAQGIKTFTIDGIIFASNTQTFTIDGIIFATLTSTFTIDGIIRALTQAVFTIDGIVKTLNNPSTFTIDGIVLVQTTKTFTIDGIVLVITQQTFTIDGIIKVLNNEATFTIDAIVKTLGNFASFTIDGIVRETFTFTFTIDGIIRETFTETITIDALVKTLNNPSTFTLDGIVRETQTAIFSIDGIVKVLNNHVQFTIDGIVKIIQTASFTADAIILVVTSQTFTIDGIVLVHETKTFTIDALIEASVRVSFTIDAVIQVQGNILTFTIDMIIVQGQFGPVGGLGKEGLYSEKDQPKPLHTKVPTIGDPDDVPILYNKRRELLDGF